MEMSLLRRKRNDQKSRMKMKRKNKTVFRRGNNFQKENIPNASEIPKKVKINSWA